MEGSKANSFKSPAGAEHSMVVRKLARLPGLGSVTIESRVRTASSSHQKQDFRALRNDRFPSTFPPDFAAEIGVCHRAHPRSAAALTIEP